MFNILGGIVAYFAIRDDDPKKAKSCLLLGIILAAIPLLLFVLPVLVGIAILPHFIPQIPMQHMNYV
jgi:hypothetical protein